MSESSRNGRESLPQHASGLGLPKTLIVEDSPQLARHLEACLTELGCHVAGVVDTGEAAISFAKAEQPALVLMDVRLAGALDGLEAARIIKNEVDCALVFATGYSDDETLARAEALEPSGFVLKPVVPAMLRATLRMALHRHRAERERARLDRLRTEADTRLRAVLDHIRDAVVSTDAEGRIVAFNQGAEMMFGRPTSDCIGKPFSQLLSPDDGDVEARANSLLGSTRAEPGALLTERAVRGDGTVFTIETAVSRIDFEDDVATVACIRDVTARERWEREVRLAGRLQAIGALSASVAHNFNNLLMSLESNTFLASRRAGPAAAPYLQDLMSAIETGRVWTRQLLRLTRLPGGPIPVTTVDLRQAVGNTQRLLQRVLRKNLRLAMHCDDAGFVKSDGYLVEHVMINLVTNAADAMPDGGEISIRTFKLRLSEPKPVAGRDPLAAGVYAAINVSDTGIGISESDRSHMFEPFFSTKPDGKGTGIGLYTTRDLVQGAGGDVWFESTVGVGSTFTVVLPTVPEAPTAP